MCAGMEGNVEGKWSFAVTNSVLWQAVRPEREVAMEFMGELLLDEKGYWIINDAERWMCPIAIGDRVEVLIGGKWLAATLQSDGYFYTVGGRRLLLMQLMRVRMAG